MTYPLDLRINAKLTKHLRKLLIRERKARGIAKTDYDTAWVDDRGYMRVGYGAVHYMTYVLAGNQVPKGFVVHHVNGIKTDNRIENLVAISERSHNSLHYYMSRNKVLLDRESTLEYCRLYDMENPPKGVRPKVASRDANTFKHLSPEEASRDSITVTNQVSLSWRHVIDWLQTQAQSWQLDVVADALLQIYSDKAIKVTHPGINFEYKYGSSYLRLLGMKTHLKEGGTDGTTTETSGERSGSVPKMVESSEKPKAKRRSTSGISGG